VIVPRLLFIIILAVVVRDVLSISQADADVADAFVAVVVPPRPASEDSVDAGEPTVRWVPVPANVKNAVAGKPFVIEGIGPVLPRVEDRFQSARIGRTNHHAIRAGEEIWIVRDLGSSWTRCVASGPVSAIAYDGERGLVCQVISSTGSAIRRFVDPTGNQIDELLFELNDNSDMIQAVSSDGRCCVSGEIGHNSVCAKIFYRYPGSLAHSSLGPIWAVLPIHNDFAVTHRNRYGCVLTRRALESSGRLFNLEAVWAGTVTDIAGLDDDGRVVFWEVKADGSIKLIYVSWRPQGGGAPGADCLSKQHTINWAFPDIEGIEAVHLSVGGWIVVHTTALFEGKKSGNVLLHCLYALSPDGKSSCMARWARGAEPNNVPLVWIRLKPAVRYGNILGVLY